VHGAPSLAPYRAKRRFDETREPRGGTAAAGARYLVQKHDATRLHYDFRLELDGVLLSWAITRGPSYDPKDKRLAVRTEDHPLEYGSFEGAIPKGNYGGGTVMLWDTGSWEPIGDPRKGLAEGKFAFRLHGERLRGRWALVRMRPRAGEKRENWLLIKERDELAGTHADLLETGTSSIVSGRTMEQIAHAGGVWARKDDATKLPAFIAPALATLVDTPPHGKDWLFEVKYDGYRALIATDGANVRIYTRSGLDWTARFPDIAASVAALKLRGTLLDGEIVVIGKNGITDFGALVAALEDGSTALSCFLFDILTHDGKDLRKHALKARKAALRRLIGTQPTSAPLQISEDFSGDGEALLQITCAHGLEGLIAKRTTAPYRSGRHADWLKIKCHHGQEFVILGFSASGKSRPFASLLMGLRENGALRYAGRVGSGFSDAALARLAAWRDAHRRPTPACDVPAAMRRGVTWVKPELVAQIAFAGWTPDGLIRHGRFSGLREDKPSTEVGTEMPKPLAVVNISHPDRVIYPDSGLTKADLAAYIQRAAPLMLPYVTDRFVSLVRCPEGAAGECFFQRHPTAGFGKAWLSQDFLNPKGKHETYVYCKSAAALLAAVQMGVLEFHIWGSRRDAPEKPDHIVFDLDPDPALGFDIVKQAAKRLRDVLEALELTSLPMLSGGKGIHVVVPLQRQHKFPVVKQFSAAVARRMAADAPGRFVAAMSKAKRTGRIFIDYFRNDVGATAIAPYSPRARPTGAVAWPCSWAELEQHESAQAMTITRALQAISADENGWSAYEGLRQTLTAATLRAIGLPA
jgi:bifunctional non-homologous end joining protein LigD